MLSLIAFIFQLYSLILFAYIILSLLINFGAVSMNTPLVAQAYKFLYAINEPILAPIRRRIPPFNGLDLSPLILLIGIRLISLVLGIS